MSARRHMASAPSPALSRRHSPHGCLTIRHGGSLSYGCPWKRLLHHAWIKFQCWLSGGRRACSTCYVQSVHWQCSYTCALCSDIKSFHVCSSFVAMSRNQIWEGFCKSETDASKAKCTECRSSYHLSVINMQNQTASRLEVHLEKFHKEQFVSYSERKAEPPVKKMKLDEQVSATPTLVQLSIPLFPFCFHFRPKVTGNFRFRSKIIFHFRWRFLFRP